MSKMKDFMLTPCTQCGDLMDDDTLSAIIKGTLPHGSVCKHCREKDLTHQ